MARLDEKREKDLSPHRIEFATDKLLAIGIEPFSVTDTAVKFIHKGETVTIFPYSGWFSGKTVKDGRGIQNLLNQLKNK